MSELPSLNSRTLKTLEVRVTRVWVRHKWALPLKLLRAIKLLKVKKDPLLFLPQYSCPFSAIGLVVTPPVRMPSSWENHLRHV